ncbi:MAG TPA: carboxymuconolactone decarboxylase family protein [Moheibacter sp.]|nr:carboxymuconolactone decarboxylase family protein [Moheibacter sp.]
MKRQIEITPEAHPRAYKAMMALEAYLAQVSISGKIKDLIKIRASYLNGCSYCVDMHTKEAMNRGETLQRILLIPAWKEAAKFFTEAEQVVLNMTEEITLVHQRGLSDATYENANRFFNETEIAEIIMTIVTINAWNRIAISTHTQIE